MGQFIPITAFGRSLVDDADAAAARATLGLSSPGVPEFISGLLADYRFDDGSGTRLTDYSGLGNHGTLGTAGATPTWTAAGLAFDGGDRVVLPSALLAQIRSVVFYGSLTTLSAYNVVLSSDQNSGGLMWGINANTGNFIPNPFYWVGGVGEGLRAINDTYVNPGGSGAAWVQPGTTDRLYLNGLPAGICNAGAGGDNTATTGRAGGLCIGANPGNGGLVPWNGVMNGMAIFSSVLSDAQVLACHNYYAALAAERFQPVYANSATGRQLIVCGDSISGTLSGALTAWPTVANSSYAQTWTTTNKYLDGQTMQTIVGSIRSRTIQNYASRALNNVVAIFAGTNDFFLDAASAATVFGYLNTAVGYALAAGFKVIVIPMLSRRISGVIYDTQKNSYNALISANTWGNNATVIPVASLPNLVPDGSYANATYFSDETHPTQTGLNEIAAAVVTAVNTIAARTSAPFDDATAIIKGSADATKLLRIEVDGFTTGTTRVLTPPNANATIAGLEVSQTFTALQTFRVSPTSPNPVGGTGVGNERFGANAFSSNTTGIYNTAFGLNALTANTTGNQNLAFGVSALATNTTGSFNVAIGYGPLAQNNGDYNIAIGFSSLGANTSGTQNVAIGVNALLGNSTGSFNVASGIGALAGNTTGSQNTSIGYVAGFGNTSGSGNVFIGGNDGVLNCGQTLTTGDYNTLVGPGSDVAASSTTLSIALGRAALAASNEFAVSPYTNFQTFYGLSSTSAKRQRADITLTNVDNTDATRKYRFVLNAWDTAAREVMRGEASGSAPMAGFLGAGAVVRQTSGADLTNSVTAGGTDDTIANYTDLVIYANDAAAIRNDIYQLTRKLKQVNDALRLFGFLN